MLKQFTRSKNQSIFKSSKKKKYLELISEYNSLIGGHNNNFLQQ